MSVRSCFVWACVTLWAWGGLSVAPDDVWAAGEETVAGDADHGEHALEGEHSEPPSPVSVDPDLAIVTAVIFLVLLAVLWKFAWGPICQALDQREKSVADNIAAAQRSNDEARRLLAEHEAKLAGAAAEVKQLLDQARHDADSQKQKIVSEAQAAAKSEKDRALREIEAATNSALQQLASKSVDTAVNLAGKIVKRQLTAEDHAELIGDALNRFPHQN